MWQECGEDYANRTANARDTRVQQPADGNSGAVNRRFGYVLLAAVLLVSAYAGYAAWLGPDERLVLLNGTTKPARISVAGQEVAVEPGGTGTVSIVAGEHRYVMTSRGRTVAEGTITLGPSFWMRPFDNSVVVLNPDDMGLLARGEVTYDGDGSRRYLQTGEDGLLFRPGIVSRYTKRDFTFDDVPRKIPSRATDPTTVVGALRNRIIGPAKPFKRSFLVTQRATTQGGRSFSLIYQDTETSDRAIEAEVRQLQLDPYNLSRSIPRHSNPDQLWRVVFTSDESAPIQTWLFLRRNGGTLESSRAILDSVRQESGGSGMQSAAVDFGLAQLSPDFADAEPLLLKAHAAAPNLFTAIALIEGRLSMGRVDGLDELFQSAAAELRETDYQRRRRLYGYIAFGKTLQDRWAQRHAAVGRFVFDRTSLETPRVATRMNAFDQMLYFGAAGEKAKAAELMSLTSSDGQFVEPKQPGWPYYIGARDRDQALKAYEQTQLGIQDVSYAMAPAAAVIQDDVETFYSTASNAGLASQRDLITALMYHRQGRPRLVEVTLDQFSGNANVVAARHEPFREVFRGDTDPDLDTLSATWPPVVEKALLLTLVGIQHPGLREDAFRLAESLNYTPGIAGLLIEETIKGYRTNN